MNYYRLVKMVYFLQGVHVIQTLNISQLWDSKPDSNVFFYGSYKLRSVLVDKNNRHHSCFQLVFDVLRPWESPIP